MSLKKLDDEMEKQNNKKVFELPAIYFYERIMRSSDNPITINIIIS